MIWLTWRQFRAQAAMIYGGAAVLGLLLAVTGPRLARLRQTAGTGFLDDISGSDRALYIVATLAVLALPALIGLFWGAPLITRELDAGTQKLAWTQTTRARWLITKLVVIGGAAMAVAALLSLAVTWWASPVDAAIASVTGLPAPGFLVFTRISREIFDSRGIVPAGYSAFAFVLGVTIGVLVRRTLATMALFLAAFAVSQIFMSVAVRPELAAHDQLTTTITAANLQSLDIANTITIVVSEPGAWITAQQTLDGAGQPAKAPAAIVNCMMHPGHPLQSCLTRLADLGYRQRVSYIPASSFWQLQLTETALYLLAALTLSAGCVVAIRRRRT